MDSLTVDSRDAGGAKVRSHRDLLVRQKAMGLVDRVYDLADSFPAREGYGLTSQVTRAVVSVPANIAEGQARSTAKDFANFLSHCLKSANESKFWLALLRDTGKGAKDKINQLLKELIEISKILGTSVKTLRSK